MSVLAERLDPIRLRRRMRHFMVGSTGTGKSTLSAALLGEYHERFPGDNVYIVDPKRRFVPVLPPSDDYLGMFPDGWREVRHGRRDGVSVVGRVLSRPAFNEGAVAEAFILQDEDVIGRVLDWLYEHATVERPSLLYCDESFDFMRGSRADPRLRRILQQGREIGVGALIINQRPHWIDATILSESQYFYIGSLLDPRDREAMVPHVQGTPLKAKLERPWPYHQWLYVDRLRWGRSRYFDLRIGR